MKYFERRRKAKLYRQWVERAGLPPEASPPETQKSENTHPPIDSPELVRPVPENPPTVYAGATSQVATHPDITGDMLAEINKRQPRLPLLYIILGISIAIVLGALILLVVWLS